MLARGRVQPDILPVPGVRQVFAPLTIEDDPSDRGSRERAPRIRTIAPAPGIQPLRPASLSRRRPSAIGRTLTRNPLMKAGIVFAGFPNQPPRAPQARRFCPRA